MKQTICFDGPKFERLVYAKDENSAECREIKAALEQVIMQFIEVGDCDFFTGNRRGIEMWAAEIILNKMEQIGRASCRERV